jgi:hypothetical protein
VIALFPNAAALTIKWQVSDVGHHDFQPSHSGNQLRQLKRLDMLLETDHQDSFDSDPYTTPQLPDAQMLMDHLHLPSLETFTIKFQVLDRAQGYIDDFKAIRGMLCGIESRMLQRVIVNASIPIRKGPFPEPWVSACFAFLSRRFSPSFIDA